MSTEQDTYRADVQMYPVRIGSRYGYINALGEVVHRPQFDIAGSVKNGVGLVCMGDCWLVITASLGTRSWPSDLEPYGSYREGLCGARRRADPDGGCYVDEAGRVAIDGRFGLPFPFFCGVAVAERQRKYGAISKQGDDLIPFQYNHLSEFNGGDYAAVRLGDRTGVIDRANHMLCPCRFLFIGIFTAGAASAFLGKGSGVISPHGEWLLPPRWDELGYRIAEGLLAARQGKNWGFIDLQGTWAIPPCFTDVGYFREGTATVMVGGEWGDEDHASGGKMGIIDRLGRFVVEPLWDGVRNFDGELASVGIGDLANELGRWGYVNRQGQVVWEPS